MRGSSYVLVWLVLHMSGGGDSVPAPNALSFLGKSLASVTEPLSTVATTTGSNTWAVATSLGQGLQTVGKPLGSAAGGLANVSVGVGKTVGQVLQKEIQTVKQPIDVTLTYIGSSQCQNVQKLLGVSYQQLQGDNEPNLDNLEIVYKTKYTTTTANIMNAPATLRQARKFDNDDRLVVYFHGFTDDPGQKSFTQLSQAYLAKDRMSLIALDASSLIRWFYARASTFVQYIGEAIAAVLAALVGHGQDPAKIHLVGHSLGGHIAGYAGKAFQLLTGKKIGRITGLDPAGPCFSHLEPRLRLHHDDADYVDAIHTDAGVYGLSDPVGHKDYYPNRGTMQPGCLLQTCSHSRVYELYAESVLNPTGFPSVRCANWAAFRQGNCEYDKTSYMGYASKPGNDGLYFLQTNLSSPYSLGAEGCKFRNTDGIVMSVANVLG
ncbi:pancreatic triacylglycerol lipase-like isoform X2 [Pararge aegeria]|uniref:pancreatic triacylglycerol lipase-like isoform X2 n=1 Tax=Pararge aegeria TaxID=116150 RepID=UPI0019D0CF6E|nr:pancreatic triacylglycerol lipase-like isoform X2 [Pararge aegeria]